MQLLISKWERLNDKAAAIDQLLRAPWSRGQELPSSIRQRVSSIWSSEPEFRTKLTPIIVRAPCPEFQRPFLRSLESSWFDRASDDQVLHVDWEGWLSFDESLTNVLLSIVKKRASRFNQATPALFYCADWARYFDGGDEAWRMFALVWKRLMRSSKRPGLAYHLVTCHSFLTVEEESKVNRHLHSLGCDGIQC